MRTGGTPSRPGLTTALIHAALLVAMLGGCAAGGGRASAGPAVVSGSAIEGRKGFYRAGELSFGGQPDPEHWDAFRAEGVTTVINLRSQTEMDELLAEEGLDEPASVRAVGMNYIHIPLGGDDGYDPADLDAFADAIEGVKGPVLVHCLSGARARTMWQAYLITRRGYSIEQAEAVTSTLGGGPTSLERLLGREVRSRVGPARRFAP